MKRSLLVILLVSSSIILLAKADLLFFHAKSNNENIELTWQTSIEISVKEFVVERRTANGSFVNISSVLPKGSNSVYSYIDENVFKTNDLIYIYRLKIIDIDGTESYSREEVPVSHSTTTVKQTWGSIKALFR